MLKTFISDLKAFLFDDRGALTTLEVIGYTVLIGTAVALVGYGFTALSRGKTGAAMNAIRNMKAMSGQITSSSTYNYNLTTDSATGMPTGATGN